MKLRASLLILLLLNLLMLAQNMGYFSSLSEPTKPLQTIKTSPIAITPISDEEAYPPLYCQILSQIKDDQYDSLIKLATSLGFSVEIIDTQKIAYLFFIALTFLKDTDPEDTLHKLADPGTTPIRIDDNTEQAEFLLFAFTAQEKAARYLEVMPKSNDYSARLFSVPNRPSERNIAILAPAKLLLDQLGVIKDAYNPSIKPCLHSDN